MQIKKTIKAAFIAWWRGDQCTCCKVHCETTPPRRHDRPTNAWDALVSVVNSLGFMAFGAYIIYLTF